MTHITMLYGTRYQTDFAHLRAQLLTPINSRDSIQEFIGFQELLHDQFAESQQPLSELDKCYHFREAVKTQALVQRAIDSYLVATPLVSEQTFVAHHPGCGTSSQLHAYHCLYGIFSQHCYGTSQFYHRLIPIFSSVRSADYLRCSSG